MLTLVKHFVTDEQYGIYSRIYWATSISDFRRGTGRFASLVRERETRQLEESSQEGESSSQAKRRSVRSSRQRKGEAGGSPDRALRPSSAKRIKIEDPDNELTDVEGDMEDESKEDYEASPAGNTQKGLHEETTPIGDHEEDHLERSLAEAYEFYIQKHCKRKQTKGNATSQAVNAIIAKASIYSICGYR